MSGIQRLDFDLRRFRAEIVASLGRSKPDVRHLVVFEPEKKSIFNFACVAGGTEASRHLQCG